jgi:flagellar basal body-associated protein FliL
MSKIRLSDPVDLPHVNSDAPATTNRGTVALVAVTIIGLVLTCAALLLAVGVLAYFVINGDFKPSPSDKAAVVAEKAIEQYAENVARVNEHMAQQVLDGKVKNKVALSSQSNSQSAAARLAAFKELGELDNATFPDDFAGHEREVADYLLECAKGHRRAVE